MKLEENLFKMNDYLYKAKTEYSEAIYKKAYKIR